MKQRSFIVSVLAGLGIGSGVIGCAFAAVLLWQGVSPAGFGFLLGSPATLIVSLGLWRRRDWARRSYVGVLALGAVGMIVRLVRDLPDAPWGAYVVVATVLLVNGLLILKLCSPATLDEFALPSEVATGQGMKH